MQWDPGPPPTISQILEQAPLNEYQDNPARFRLEWGPIYYRGRLDGSAKVIVIGQDPSVDENVARRILVGRAGQRVQGFLNKLGLTRSYVMINASLYSIFGQFDDEIKDFMDRAPVETWRNRLLDALAEAAGPNLQAVIGFGRAARHAIETWPGAGSLFAQGRAFTLTHPTARPTASIFANWNASLPQLGAHVTPDSDGTVDLTPYSGTAFKASELSRIPLGDFAFGAPVWMGTGDTAARLQPDRPLPPITTQKPTILWTAIEAEG